MSNPVKNGFWRFLDTVGGGGDRHAGGLNDSSTFKTEKGSPPKPEKVAALNQYAASLLMCVITGGRLESVELSPDQLDILKSGGWFRNKSVQIYQKVQQLITVCCNGRPQADVQIQEMAQAIENDKYGSSFSLLIRCMINQNLKADIIAKYAQLTTEQQNAVRSELEAVPFKFPELLGLKQPGRFPPHWQDWPWYVHGKKGSEVISKANRAFIRQNQSEIQRRILESVRYHSIFPVKFTASFLKYAYLMNIPKIGFAKVESFENHVNQMNNEGYRSYFASNQWQQLGFMNETEYNSVLQRPIQYILSGIRHTATIPIFWWYNDSTAMYEELQPKTVADFLQILSK